MKTPTQKTKPNKEPKHRFNKLAIQEELGYEIG